MTWQGLHRQDRARPGAMVGLVPIPRLPSLIRAELRRQMEQQEAPGGVTGFCVWHDPECPAPAGGACGCARVAVTLVAEKGAARGSGGPGRAIGREDEGSIVPA